MGLIKRFMASGMTAVDFVRHVVPTDTLRESDDREPARESAESWTRRHTVPGATACFQATLQETTDSGKLAAYREQRFTRPDSPTSGRLAVGATVLQESATGQTVTPPTSGNALVDYRRRLLARC
jgi:hypothetical protein